MHRCLLSTFHQSNLHTSVSLPLVPTTFLHRDCYLSEKVAANSFSLDFLRLFSQTNDNLLKLLVRNFQACNIHIKLDTARAR